MDETPPTADELPGWQMPGLDFPTFRIILLAKIITRLTNRQLGEGGELSYAEWRLLGRLAVLGADGGTVGQVADLAWVDRAEVSRAATALEERGYSARRDNPLDRRTPVLLITDLGRAAFQRSLDVRKNFHEELLSDLSPAEVAELDRLLAKVGGRLKAMVG